MNLVPMLTSTLNGAFHALREMGMELVEEFFRACMKRGGAAVGNLRPNPADRTCTMQIMNSAMMPSALKVEDIDGGDVADEDGSGRKEEDLDSTLVSERPSLVTCRDYLIWWKSLISYPFPSSPLMGFHQDRLEALHL